MAAVRWSMTAMRSTCLGKEFLWIAIGQVAAGFGALAGVKLLTRAMTPQLYGELSLALTGTILAQQCIGGPVGQAAMRFYSASREEGSTGIYLRALNRLMLKGSVMQFAASLVVLAGFGLLGHAEHSGLIVLASLLAAFTGYNVVFDAIQSGGRNRAVAAFHQAAIQWLRPLVCLALLATISFNSNSAVAAYIAATLLVIGSQIAFLRKQLRPPIAPRSSATPSGLERRLRDYALPFATWGVLVWLQMASDRWFLGIFRDATSVAAYTICFQLGYYPLILLGTALSNLAAPILFQIAGAGEEPERLEAASRANRIHVQVLVGITTVATVLLALYHPWIFRLFTHAAYAPYSGYLPVLAGSAGIFAIAQAASLTCLIHGRSADLTSAKCLPAAAGIVLNLAGAYWFGVPGTVAATLLFSIIYLAAVCRLVRKLTPRSARLTSVVANWPEGQAAEG